MATPNPNPATKIILTGYSEFHVSNCKECGEPVIVASGTDRPIEIISSIKVDWTSAQCNMFDASSLPLESGFTGNVSVDRHKCRDVVKIEECEFQLGENDSESNRFDYSSRLYLDSDVSTTSPCVKGTWITASHVVSLIVDGWSWSDIMRSHSEINENDIRACLAYTVDEDSKDEEFQIDNCGTCPNCGLRIKQSKWQEHKLICDP